MTSLHSKRNYWAFLFEGGFFVGAIGFVNHQTLLPALILAENGPAWLAALTPSIMVIGMFLMPIFNAHYIDTLKRYKPFVVPIGFFQRIVFLIAALLLIGVPMKSTSIVIILALAPLLSGILGGVSLSAWQQLYMVSVPTRRRASNMALRFLIGGITGMIAGRTIEWVLGTYDSQQGYGLLFLFCSGGMFLSFISLLLVREPVRETPPGDDSPRLGFRRNLVEFSGMMKSSAQLRRFVVAVMGMHLYLIITPFYAVHIMHSLAAPASFLGVLAFWQMLGQSAGNLASGLLGDRLGSRTSFIIGALGFIAVILPAMGEFTYLSAKILYALYGFFMMVLIVGKDAMILEIAPAKMRSSFLSTVSLASMLTMLCASGLSYVLWTYLNSFAALVIGASLGCGLCAGALVLIRDPHSESSRHPFARLQRGILRYFR